MVLHKNMSHVFRSQPRRGRMGDIPVPSFADPTSTSLPLSTSFYLCNQVSQPRVAE